MLDSISISNSKSNSSSNSSSVINNITPVVFEHNDSTTKMLKCKVNSVASNTIFDPLNPYFVTYKLERYSECDAYLHEKYIATKHFVDVKKFILLSDFFIIEYKETGSDSKTFYSEESMKSEFKFYHYGNSWF